MNKKYYGIFLAAFSSTLWGIGGNFTQYIFNNSNFNYISLVAVRMLVAGILFILYGSYKDGINKAYDMVNNRYKFFDLLIYSIFGMLGVQLPFFATIQYSSAPFATLMQFGAPILVIIFVCLKYKKKPQISEVICTLLILLGVFFVVTNGSTKQLSIDPRAILWGLVTSFGYAFYIIDAKKFFRWPTSFLMGFSMIIGSVLLLPFYNVLIALSYFKDLKILFAFLVVIIIGTVIPFYLLIESSRYIKPTLTCMLAVFEPVVSLLIAINFMGEVFGIFQLFGIVIILLSIIVVSKYSKN